MTYVHNPKSEVSPYSDLRVAITRQGRKLVNALVNDRYCGTYCDPEGLRVVDVESDGDPDVLLDLYSGGAHCCNVTEVFRYSTALRTYTKIDHVWGDPGYKLDKLGGSKAEEFVTYDDLFAYKFTAYAFSGLPIDILRLENGAFKDVSADYPALVRSDAAKEWGYWQSNRKEGTGLGFLAAWAADEYTLGRGAAAASTLAQFERAGQLHSGSGYPWVGGAKFIVQLNKFLRKIGYEH